MVSPRSPKVRTVLPLLVMSMICATASAATLIPVGGNGLVVAGLNDPTGLTVHVAPLDATTPNVALLSDGVLNPLVIVDPQPGTDPNQVLVGASSVAAGESVAVVFDFTTPTLAPDLSTLALRAGAIPTGTVTDPGLLALLSGVSLWSFTSPTGPQTGLPAVFVLSSVVTGEAAAVPEPATCAITLAGLVVIAIRARRRHA